jgi:glycosyltransferase involved in cell wall biosynthesis
VTEPSLLLLIPAYNEERRIEPVLRDYARYFQEQYQGKFELVVVMNGCRDNTLGVVQRVMQEHSIIKALEFKEPIGKGGALIEGLKLAPLADLIGYVDADGAPATRISRSGAAHARRGLRDRVALAARGGAASGTIAQAPVRQPRLSSDRSKPALDEHPRHPVRRESDAARSGRKNPFLAPDR